MRRFIAAMALAALPVAGCGDILAPPKESVQSSTDGPLDDLDGTQPGFDAREQATTADVATRPSDTARSDTTPGRLDDTGPDVSTQGDMGPSELPKHDAPPTPPVAVAPVYLTFSAHGHAYNLPASAASDPDLLTIKESRFAKHRTEIQWLAERAEAYGLRMSFNMNGEYARDARLLFNASDHFEELASRGHTISAHFHLSARMDDSEYWATMKSDTVTPDALDKVLRQNIEEVQTTLGGSIRRIDPGVPQEKPWQLDLLAQVTAEYGIDINPAGERFTYATWNHFPMNPFRRHPGADTTEDSDGPIIAVPVYSQMGKETPQGLHKVSTSLPQMKRHFIQLLATRHYAQVSGETPRIWTLGAMTHPDSNAQYREAVEGWMEWMSVEVSKWTDATGQPLTQWVTDHELADAFEAWEEQHPGVSSFSFDSAAHESGEEQPYPYALEPLVLAIVGADYETRLEADDDVMAFRLRHRELMESIDPGPSGNTLVSLGPPEHPVVVAWRNKGEGEVDLSEVFAGDVQVLDGATGEVTMAAATAVWVGTTPQVVVPAGVALPQ